MRYHRIAQIFASRGAMIGKLKELVAEQTELRRRNKLLELWIVKRTKKVSLNVQIATA